MDLPHLTFLSCGWLASMSNVNPSGFDVDLCVIQFSGG